MNGLTIGLAMSKTRKTEITLKKFVKRECANYDKHCQSCLFTCCRIFDGKRCGYFEKCVLGPSDYKYRLPGYDYAKLFAQCAKQTGAQKQEVKVRRCECGTPLRLRQRYCEKCIKQRAKKASRKRQRKIKQESLKKHD